MSPSSLIIIVCLVFCAGCTTHISTLPDATTGSLVHTGMTIMTSDVAPQT